MTNSPDHNAGNLHEDDSTPDSDMIKVVDRKGNVKVIPRSQFEARKRRSKKRESSNRNLPVKEIIAVIFILAAIVAASYLALHYVK